ncbi:sensor histidine kinase [Caldalkalibacillus mannanilyticus]|uniref:sensor histidine kinase n=1 Tax=Caldalkalibacillus mannanilyticus TaxID=1418 RepID=UPI000468D7E1|nr:ATP-binding protein [Caldalkalibacillus mannanilyticus]
MNNVTKMSMYILLFLYVPFFIYTVLFLIYSDFSNFNASIVSTNHTEKYHTVTDSSEKEKKNLFERNFMVQTSLSLGQRSTSMIIFSALVFIPPVLLSLIRQHLFLNGSTGLLLLNYLFYTVGCIGSLIFLVDLFMNAGLILLLKKAALLWSILALMVTMIILIEKLVFSMIRISGQKQDNKLLLEVQDKERKSLSHYLHDEILQHIIFINMYLESLHNKSAINSGSFERVEITRLITLSKQMIRNIRNKCFDLYPSMIEDIGFLDTCEYYFTSNQLFFSQAILKWRCTTSAKELKVLSILQQKVIFRCLKELVINALKHSECTELSVEIKKNDQMIMFSVIDNGKGIKVSFDPQTFVENHHFGLISVKQSIEQIDGHLDIYTSKESGTKVTMIFHTH